MRHRRWRWAAALSSLPLGVVALTACSDDGYVGTSEEVTVVVGDQPPCNVQLADGDDARHGLDWYSKATVWPSRALAGEYRGTLTYESADEAVFRGGNVVARFEGKETDAFVTLECPVDERWNPEGSA